MLLQFLCGQSSVPFSLRNPAPLQPTMALIFPLFLLVFFSLFLMFFGDSQLNVVMPLKLLFV